MSGRPPRARGADLDRTGAGEGASSPGRGEDAGAPPVLSAAGTRLNRRGLRTRATLIEQAVRCLVDGGPAAASASAVVRRAGVTWGTVQHQFGDVDGLWAAVLDGLAAELGLDHLPVPGQVDLAERVEAVVHQLWTAMQLPAAIAVHHLRSTLPRTRRDLLAEYPRTTAALAEWDAQWNRWCERALDGLGLAAERTAPVRLLLPAAVRGLWLDQELAISGREEADPALARLALCAAVAAHLAG